MKERHLLQRILPPPGQEVFHGIGSFSGLSKETKEFLFSVANFDYMGSAEFEMGVIPKSLAFIYKDQSCELHEREINGVTFFILIDPQKLDSYLLLIKEWCQENYYKEYYGLKDVIEKNNKQNIQGWLDIDDNVLFFINKEMAEIMRDLLTPTAKV